VGIPVGTFSVYHWLIVCIIVFGFVLPAIPLWRRIRKAGLVKPRVRAFSWNIYGTSYLQGVAQRMDDHALLWAYFLPDHTAKAKSVVAQELARREYSQDTIERWTPPAEEFVVPPVFARMPTRTGYARLVRVKKAWLTGLRLNLALIVLLLACNLAFSTAYDIPKDLSDAPWLAQVEFFGSETLASIHSWTSRLVIASAVGLLAIPILGGIIFRKRALRILLLRPFGDKRMTQPLKRFTTRTIGSLGYVYTLSDRGYRPNPLFTLLMWVPIQGFDLLVLVVMSPIIRNSFRITTVKSAHTFRHLQRFLLRRFRPSYISLLSAGQAFNIRSTDEWWQLCVRVLMQSSDLIVVDLSKVKSGTAWELDQLKSTGLVAKSVFVIADDHRDELAATLGKHLGSQPPAAIHVYDARGEPRDPATLVAHVEATLASRLGGAVGAKQTG